MQIENLPLIIFTFLLFSCESKEVTTESTEKKPTSDLHQWRMAKEVNAWTGTTVYFGTEDETIYYRFFSDGTFNKITVEGDSVSGHYHQSKTDFADIELDFPVNAIGRNSCVSDKEYLYFSSDTLINDARACDGPMQFFVPF